MLNSVSFVPNIRTRDRQEAGPFFYCAPRHLSSPAVYTLNAPGAINDDTLQSSYSNKLFTGPHSTPVPCMFHSAWPLKAHHRSAKIVPDTTNGLLSYVSHAWQGILTSRAHGSLDLTDEDESATVRPGLLAPLQWPNFRFRVRCGVQQNAKV